MEDESSENKVYSDPKIQELIDYVKALPIVGAFTEEDKRKIIKIGGGLGINPNECSRIIGLAEHERSQS